MLSSIFAPARGLFAAKGVMKVPARAEDVPQAAPENSRSRSTSAGSRSSFKSSALESNAATSSQPASPEPAPATATASVHLDAPPGLENLPVFSRNTFIDMPIGRPLSLDDYFQDREIHSCPASAIGAPPGLSPALPDRSPFGSPYAPVAPAQWPRTMSGEGLEEVLAFLAHPVHRHMITSGEGCDDLLAGLCQPYGSPYAPVAPVQWPRTMSGEGLEDLLVEPAFATQSHLFLSVPAGPMLVPTVVPPPPPTVQAPTLVGTVVPPPPAGPAIHAPMFFPTVVSPPPAGLAEMVAPPDYMAAAPQVLSLVGALLEPELGSPDMPTMGSAGHRFGTCKPCAFLFTKGCGNGVQCIFCHLCAPGEKKRRQKEKKECFRQMNDCRRTIGRATMDY